MKDFFALMKIRALFVMLVTKLFMESSPLIVMPVPKLLKEIANITIKVLLSFISFVTIRGLISIKNITIKMLFIVEIYINCNNLF